MVEASIFPFWILPGFAHQAAARSSRSFSSERVAPLQKPLTHSMVRTSNPDKESKAEQVRTALLLPCFSGLWQAYKGYL